MVSWFWFRLYIRVCAIFFFYNSYNLLKIKKPLHFNNQTIFLNFSITLFDSYILTILGRLRSYSNVQLHMFKCQIWDIWRDGLLVINNKIHILGFLVTPYPLATCEKKWNPTKTFSCKIMPIWYYLTCTVKKLTNLM